MAKSNSTPFAVQVEIDFEVPIANTLLQKSKTKQCKSCHKKFPATIKFFAKNHRYSCGLNSRCRDCVRIYDRNRSRLEAKKKKDFSGDSTRGKTCLECQTYKSLLEFHRSNLSKDGYRTSCIVCSPWQKNRKGKAPDHWIKVKIYQTRALCKQRGIQFDIDENFVLELLSKQQGKCYWYKVPLIFDETVKKHPLKPSLDRLNPKKGYTKNNVVLSCYAANIGKNTCDPDVFAQFVKTLANSLKNSGLT